MVGQYVTRKKPSPVTPEVTDCSWASVQVRTLSNHIPCSQISIYIDPWTNHVPDDGSYNAHCSLGAAQQVM